MRRAITPCLTALALIAGLVACDRAGSEEKAAADPGEQRLILSQGYSMLYKDASGIGLADLLLLVKIESQPFDDLVSELGRYGDELKAELQAAAQRYPGVRLDLDPLPVMEQRKRLAIAKDRTIDFLPFSGRSRVEYERTMLISTSNALNHESHLCQVMADEETEPGLQKILRGCERRYGELRDKALALLRSEHFVAEPKS